ncbi:tRNA (guanine-N7-)-methyltransferase [Neisseria sp. HSC-16F19]|nr:tRNA (guanosine(46)-N7)-methyltransferase TrmB [Neisseria sp. HSC-16F19]MCP2041250.1 tRNA (guanine-N7-)-methyltransferase [Neisseria sp. HSC-16F19]
MTQEQQQTKESAPTGRDSPQRRSIKSFVLRQSHMTPAQQRAIDQLWPQFGVDFQAAPLDLNSVFQRAQAKILEIGFGMGTATAEIAARLPEKDFLAIDVHGPGVGNLLKLIQERELTNIRVMRHDAVEVVEHMLADASLDGIHIFFPDPWHKKRHHKRRLIQAPFVAKLLPKLKSSGYIHLATDWEEYARQMLDVLQGFTELTNSAADFATTPDYRPETKFEARGKRLGHGVWDLVFIKK